jgi:hypothetical protein
VSLSEELATQLALGSLLDALRSRFGTYELVEHWTQGEFHHDLLLRVPDGRFLVVATNCNGGVKEVLAFTEAPARTALWHWRCPTVEEFAGALPPLLEQARTVHWFDPCELLRPDARSELRPEHRQRQPGGGWEIAPACRTKPGDR